MTRCFKYAIHDSNKKKARVDLPVLKTAVAHASKLGAKIGEGYPVEPKKDPMPDVFAWTGIGSAFRKAGFREVARRSSTRPIMRFEPSPRQGDG